MSQSLEEICYLFFFKCKLMEYTTFFKAHVKIPFLHIKFTNIYYWRKYMKC